MARADGQDVRDAFHAQFVRDSLSMLQRAHIDVVAFGPSLHDRDSYYLLRAFGSIDERDRAEATFYDSPEWRQGPREAVLAAIQTYSAAVVQGDHVTMKGLRTMPTSAAAPSSADDVMTRAQFLAQAAKPTTAHGLQVHDVNVRVLGDTAIIHAATTFTHPDGRPGRGRYTDVWATRDGQWWPWPRSFRASKRADPSARGRCRMCPCSKLRR